MVLVVMIKRILQATLRKKLKDHKAIIVLGPRQVGKTTLRTGLFSSSDTLWLNGDNSDIRAIFEKPNATKLKAIASKHKILVIDEDQRIENISVCMLKK